jgi:hypothetical protein
VLWNKLPAVTLVDFIPCGATTKRRFTEGKKVVTGDIRFRFNFYQ